MTHDPTQSPFQLADDHRGHLGLGQLWHRTRALERPQRPPLLAMLSIMGAHQSLYGLTRLLQRLDDVFYSDYRQQTVKSPLFIIANPRSGTTFLHNLLALDEERYTYHRLYHTMLPSVTAYKLINAGIHVDRRVGRPLGRVVDWIDRKTLPMWDDIHPVSLNRTEEDELLFLYKLASMSICMLSPLTDDLEAVTLLDRAPKETRDAIMDFYQSCLQRHIYGTDPNKQFLGKNVLMSGRLASLLERFPDARIVYLVRHPYEAIPSFVSMFSATWQRLAPRLAPGSDAHRTLGTIGVMLYHHVHQQRSLIPSKNYLDLRYTDLIADPQAAVRQIYERFEIPISPAFEQRLTQATNRAKRYRSAHTYHLEDTGWSKEEIRAALADVFETYGFED